MATADINENQPEVYKTYEDGYLVRAMTPADAKIVQQWYSAMGVTCAADLDIPLEVFTPGQGCYIGEYNGEVVASAVRLNWGNGVYYGSYYYVEEKYRSKGFGTRLRDQVAFGHVGNNILAVDAVGGNVKKKNVEKFGYVEAFTTRRIRAQAKQDYGVLYDGKLVKADQLPFQTIIDFDNKHFISQDDPHRRKFLEKWFQVPGGNTYVALSPAGEIAGFGSRRPALPNSHPGHHQVGPVYAQSVDIAKAILAKLCQEVSGDLVTANMWVPNEKCSQMLEEFGFEKTFDVYRMHVNGNPHEYKDTVFLLTNIETCGF